MRVGLHPDAEMELLEAARWYDEQVAGLGEDLVTEVATTPCPQPVSESDPSPCRRFDSEVRIRSRLQSPLLSQGVRRPGSVAVRRSPPMRNDRVGICHPGCCDQSARVSGNHEAT